MTSGSFGATLRRLRTKRGVSIRRLAKRLGLSNAYLCRVETGHKRPLSRALRDEAAEVIGIPPDELHAAAARERGFGLELDAAERKGRIDELERMQRAHLDACETRLFRERLAELRGAEVRR